MDPHIVPNMYSSFTEYLAARNLAYYMGQTTAQYYTVIRERA
jgi:hypothetical protein